MDLVARRCLVSGRVQGVWYRASTQAKAAELGLTGHARNLDDGRVEVIACGKHEAVSALCDWLWQGSPGSSVRAVEIEDLAPEALGGKPGEFRTL
jgi:acylphosphatase